MYRFALAAVAAALIASSAAAAPRFNAPANPGVTLNVAGLDLDTEIGSRDALQRLLRAARTACSRNSVIGRVDQACVRDLGAQAVAKLNAPKVTARYETGTDLAVVQLRATDSRMAGL